MDVDNITNITAGIPPNGIIMNHHNQNILIIVDRFSMYIQGISIILSIIGNTLVVLASARSTVLSLNKFVIRYLAISDLVYSIFQIFLFHRRFNKHIWSFGQVLCVLSAISPCAIMTSLFTIVFIAYERQRSILYPFQDKLSKYQASCVVLFSWLISFVAHIPTFLNKRIVKMNEQTDCAKVPNDFVKYWDLAMFTIAYPISFASLLTFYIRIIIKVTRDKGNYNFNLSEGKSTPSITQHKKMICMLVLIVSTFFITTTPNHILILWLNFGEKNLQNSFVIFTTLYGLSSLVHLHSFINPIIYCISDPKFIKKVFIKVVDKKQLKRSLFGNPRSRAYTDTQLVFRLKSISNRLSQSVYVNRTSTFIKDSFILRDRSGRHGTCTTQCESLKLQSIQDLSQLPNKIQVGKYKQQIKIKEINEDGTEISRPIEDSCLANSDIDKNTSASKLNNFFIESYLLDPDAKTFEQSQESINKHFETDCNVTTDLLVEQSSYFYRRRSNTCGPTLQNNEDRNEKWSTETKNESYDQSVCFDNALEKDSLFVSRERSRTFQSFKEFCEGKERKTKWSSLKLNISDCRQIITERAKKNPKQNFTKSFNRKYMSPIWHKLSNRNLSGSMKAIIMERKSSYQLL